MENDEDISSMTGEGNYRRAPQYELNVVRINGKEGGFKLVDLLTPRKEGEKPVVKDLGTELEVILLKHRRKLSYWNPKEQDPKLKRMETNEHSKTDNFVMLFGPNVKGVAKDLREKYPVLRTHQILYAFVPSIGEVVRLIVKGLSLGSEKQPEEMTNYYEYFKLFSETDHMWQYSTNLKTIQVTADLGTFYAIDFKKGEKLTPERIEKIKGFIKDTHNKITEVDNYFKNKNAEEVVKDNKPKTATDTIEYPSEDIDAEDIPF